MQQKYPNGKRSIVDESAGRSLPTVHVKNKLYLNISHAYASDVSGQSKSRAWKDVPRPGFKVGNA
ncbi:uncharacterized protein PHALS_06350 [Plasmopara halstedii]|uniref:Uncharacterized protein n=1 Tax=Plasmopara halstedii TaxID=4781 RepID=A0A0P1B399_PLAHL|nr:uncharacterized protein PHALS_06350 [Plasmopara halstedii]CEG48532.1 hypothetical protein PHALS_06350 [Plasmopara halstedii]|eukprot:XP_024584901.1 hypothetical protein PHALS_06350 [Plasmopara halstedii]